MLASSGPSLLVGVRPSVNTTFTPLISSSNGGRSWSDGLIAGQLAARPDALATTAGQALALVNSRTGAEVLADVGSISKWRLLVTQAGLARASAGKSCGLGSFTSVGYLRARPLIGGSCRHAGVVGLFAEAHGAWRLVGPVLPSSLDNSRAEVLGLWTSHGMTVALVAAAGPRRTDLFAAWSVPAGGWATSLPLAVGPNELLASFGPAREKEVFVLLQNSSGADQAVLAQDGGTSWQQMPSPPTRTATIAFGSSEPTDALLANGTKFSVWSLNAGSKGWWAEDQGITVPLQYGSSS